MIWGLLLLYPVLGETTVVNIKQGVLNGTYGISRNGNILKSFLGIPYAEPPVGKLRFKAPVEPKPWNGMWDASYSRSGCVQVDGRKVVGSEDCLYLNVYTPLDAKKGDNLPVMAYFHGGAFQFGSNQDFGAEYILDRRVVLVVPNYRLGAFGFLSTGDSVVPGNFGLKDQNMLLKWVQDNIYEFGGDPNKVTLHGQSSGGMCAHLHTLSPKSKGLFHQIILQSGVGTCAFAYFGPDVARDFAKKFANEAGCPSNTSVDMLNCFIKLDPYVIPVIQDKISLLYTDLNMIFRATIEDKNDPGAFLTEFPNKMKHHSPNQPWIIGVTSAESLIVTQRFLKNNGKIAADIDKNYKTFFPIVIQYLWNMKPMHINITSMMIRKHYFGLRKIGLSTSRELTNMCSDGWFKYCATDAVVKYPGPKYLYLFDYQANHSHASKEYHYLGVSHADDFVLILYRKQFDSYLTKRDIKFSDELVKRFVNFVETGNPNMPVKIDENMMSVWKSASSRRREYLVMKFNGKMQTDFGKGMYQFWRSLPIGNKYFKN